MPDDVIHDSWYKQAARVVQITVGRIAETGRDPTVEDIADAIRQAAIAEGGRELWLVDHEDKAGNLLEHEVNADAFVEASPFKARKLRVMVIPLAHSPLGIPVEN